MGARDLYFDAAAGALYLSYVVRSEAAEDCFGLGILRAEIRGDLWDSDFGIQWVPFWATEACVQNANTHAAGGRMQKYREDLLVTIGDFNQHETGDSSLLTGERAEFGKTFQIQQNGTAKMFSRGHRNPQGLFVDDELILSTEHGPKGGDELNLIVQGEDYGWPVASYGFEYYLEDNYQRPHLPAFAEPLYSFTPSIGISEITRYSGEEFPRWENLFLIGSLRRQALFIAHLEPESHAIRHLGELHLERRIRDIAVESTGRVWILTDDAKLLRLTRSVFDF